MPNSTFETIKEYLAHYGVKGQKWGERRYQYDDGGLTPEGREHYGVGPARDDGYIDSKGVPHIGLQFFADKKNEADKVDLSKYSQEERDKMTAIIKDAKLEEQYKKALETSSGPDPYKATYDIFSTAKGFFRERRKSGISKKDYSNISDEELRQRVNRLNLEESYGRLTGDTKKVATGRDKVHEFLQDAAIIASIAGILIPLFSKKKAKN